MYYTILIVIWSFGLFWLSYYILMLWVRFNQYKVLYIFFNKHLLCQNGPYRLVDKANQLFIFSLAFIGAYFIRQLIIPKKKKVKSIKKWDYFLYFEYNTVLRI